MCEELCCESILRALASNAYQDLSQSYTSAANTLNASTLTSTEIQDRITTLTCTYDQYLSKLNQAFCKLLSAKCGKECCEAVANALASLYSSQFSSISALISSSPTGSSTVINNAICMSYPVLDNSTNLILISLVCSQKERNKLLKCCGQACDLSCNNSCAQSCGAPIPMPVCPPCNQSCNNSCNQPCAQSSAQSCNQPCAQSCNQPCAQSCNQPCNQPCMINNPWDCANFFCAQQSCGQSFNNPCDGFSTPWSSKSHKQSIWNMIDEERGKEKEKDKKKKPKEKKSCKKVSKYDSSTTSTDDDKRCFGSSSSSSTPGCKGETTKMSSVKKEVSNL